MLKRVLPYLTLLFFGVFTTSCDQKELEEVNTEKVAAVENATSANIFIEETFEGSSPLSTIHGTEFGTAHAFSVVNTPVFDGSKAARIELRDSDPLESNGTRAEMTFIKDKMQKEMWFSFAVYLPAADFGTDSRKEIISQWHQSGGTSPPSYLLIQKDKWSFEVANKMDSHVKYDLGAVAKNVWNQFTFHYIQSNGADGLIEIWHNGKKVLTHKGGNMYNLANLPKWKVGIYKWDWNGSGTTDVKKRVLYFDNIRVGTAKATLEEMTAGGTAAPATTEPTTTNPATTEPTTTNPATTDPTASTPPATDPTASTPPATEPVVTNPVTTNPVAGEATFTFVNAEADKDIKALTNGASLSLSAIKTNKVSIRVDFKEKTGSVKFALSGSKSYTSTDNAVPYALFGDNGKGNYYYGTYIPVGTYTLTATPYSQADGKGTAGKPVTVKFTIVK